MVSNFPLRGLLVLQTTVVAVGEKLEEEELYSWPAGHVANEVVNAFECFEDVHIELNRIVQVKGRQGGGGNLPSAPKRRTIKGGG